MISRDRECKTLTDKSKSHKKAKYINSDGQIDSKTDRQIERQTKTDNDRLRLCDNCDIDRQKQEDKINKFKQADRKTDSQADRQTDK